MDDQRQLKSGLVALEKNAAFTNTLRNSSTAHGETFDPEIEARLRWQFDKRVLLSAILMFLCAFIDRSNIGVNQILGMTQDLHLEGSKLNLSLTSFFIVYIVSVIPANVLCKKFGSGNWLGSLTAVFGLLTMCCAFVKGFPSLIALRCLIGLFEAGIHPGIVFTFTKFYRRHEIATRIGIQTSTASLGGSFGGLLAAGLSSIPPHGILTRWRYVFLVEGILTIFIGLFIVWFLPNDPSTAKFLSEEERIVALKRLQAEHLTTARDPTDFKAFKRAMLHVSTQLTALGSLCSLLGLNSMALFMPTLLKAMGFSTLRSQLLTVPVYAFSTMICITASILSDRLKKRGMILCVVAPLTVIGFTILVTVETNGVRYFAVFLCTTGCFCVSPILLAWGVDNAAGPAVRAIVAAYLVGGGNIGSIIATWTYMAQDAPRYLRGHYINLGAGSLALVIILMLMPHLRWENRQRDQGKRDYRLEGLSEEEAARLGHQHPDYRFTP